MKKVALVGAGVSKFGVRKATYRDLILEAGKSCFDSVPGLKPRDVEGLVVGSVMPREQGKRAVLWGMDHSSTREAVDVFVKDGLLDRFLDLVWRQAGE